MKTKINRLDYRMNALHAARVAVRFDPEVNYRQDRAEGFLVAFRPHALSLASFGRFSVDGTLNGLNNWERSQFATKERQGESCGESRERYTTGGKYIRCKAVIWRLLVSYIARGPSPTSPEFIEETGEPMQREPFSTYSYSASASPEL